MARKRLKKNNALPSNLYVSGKYFRYRNPVTGKSYGMGTNRVQAIADAKRLNRVLMPQVSVDRVQRVLANDSGTFAELAIKYLKEFIPTKGLAKRTLSDVSFRVNRLIKEVGHWPLESITVRLVSDYLDKYSNNVYLKTRNELIGIFQFGIAKGLMSPTINPARETLIKKESKRKRLPLTLEDYHAIHALAEPWLQVAMEFIFITLQRPVDLVQVKYDDIRDGVLYIRQQKVERHDNWQSNLALKVQGRLEKTIEKSRASGLITPYIIHRRPKVKRKRKDCDHWTQVQENYIGRAFAEVRDSLVKFNLMAKDLRPPFYEIKALGGHFYQTEFGWDESKVQALMGHTNADMTKTYIDRHIEWSKVTLE